MSPPESPSLAVGLYISIPFCRSKCTYCNFSSGVHPAREHSRYVSRLVEDLHGAADWAAGAGAHLPRRADSLYLGGGTPSLLAPVLIETLFTAIRTVFAVDPDAEITAECAPGQLSDATLDAMAACGVNRVSLGAQSFIDNEAHDSGRLHSRSTIEDDLRRLRASGIDNINIDLIAGLPGQTLTSWEESLTALLGSGVPHASVYMLEVDEDSRLGRELLGGGARYHAALVPGEDAIARMYERAIERLAAAGLAQYEISNFSRPDRESRHNLRYWQRRAYLGLGLDASSALYGSRGLLRATTGDDLKAYLAGSQPPETEWLGPGRRHEEAWFLGLRIDAGVEIAALEREFDPELVAPALRAAERMAADGLLAIQDGRVRLTARGRLLSNEVFQEFLAETAPHG